MPIDFERQLGAVQRSVSHTEHDGKPARAVTLSRTYPTSVEDLWDAISNPERLPRWFAEVTGELEPGGRFQITGNASGQITACVPPQHLATTWEIGEETSRVEVRLEQDGDINARLTLTHIAPVTGFWKTYGPGAVGVGWELGLMGLALHVETPDAPRPDEAEFAADPDARAFMRHSAEAWGDADIAGGEDAETARASAKRTANFYTGGD